MRTKKPDVGRVAVFSDEVLEAILADEKERSVTGIANGTIPKNAFMQKQKPRSAKRVASERSPSPTAVEKSQMPKPPLPLLPSTTSTVNGVTTIKAEPPSSGMFPGPWAQRTSAVVWQDTTPPPVRRASSFRGEVPRRGNKVEVSKRMAHLAHAREVMEHMDMYEAFEDGHKQLIKDVDNHIVQAERKESARKKMLHHKWSTKVYEKLQERIHAQMQGRKFSHLESYKQSVYDRYIHEFDAKSGHVFLDIVTPEIYNPYIPESHMLHYSLDGVRDPLESEARRRREECSVMGVNEPNYKGRDDVSINRWQNIRLIDIDARTRYRKMVKY
eukprot:Colp12_sorted_trinity150504_noHs@16924